MTEETLAASATFRTGMSLDSDPSWQAYLASYRRTHPSVTDRDLHVLADGYSAGVRDSASGIRKALGLSR